MEGQKMTRDEKIATLKIFAEMSEKEKSIFAMGALCGEYKARFSAEGEDEDEEKGA